MLNGTVMGLVTGAVAVLVYMEPISLTGKLACVMLGGGAGAKFGETCEKEFYRLKSNAQEKEISRLKAEAEAAKA
ncbi:MAG: hypothetical protein WCO53_09290 [Deltaproteobacteria bacterium]